MKIQMMNVIHNNMLNQKLTEKKQDTSLKCVTPISDAYNVTISKKGIDSYRMYLQHENDTVEQSNQNTDSYRELLSKSVVDIRGLTEYNFHAQFKHHNTELRDSKGGTYNKATDLSQSCFEVYTNMYEDIKRGYADGTREIWVVDSTAENGFRKVTEDEEIEALNSAYDFYGQVVEAYVNQGDISKKVQDCINKLQLDLQNQQYVRKSNDGDINKGLDNIHSRLMDAGQTWRDNYSMNSNNLSSLFNQILVRLSKNNIF